MAGAQHHDRVMNINESGQRPFSGVPSSTLESFDAWAQVLRTRPPHCSGDSAAAAAADVAISGPPPAEPLPDEAAAYRPTRRRGMALLHVVDDGREDGDVVRMRGDRLLVGRSEGDVVLPHDPGISGRHALIERLATSGWRLTDLGSAAGTLVRVTHARLHHGSEVQLGRSRIVFRSPEGGEGLSVQSIEHGPPVDCGIGITIGRQGCDLELDDPFVSAVHAVVHHTPRGWTIENCGLNGLWVRLERPITMRGVSQFLCGEQRFVFEPL